MSLQRFLAVLDARNKEFLRDRAALTWNIAFPVLIVLGFAFAFSGRAPELYTVGVYGDVHAAKSMTPGVSAFLNTRYIEFVPVEDLRKGIVKVERHGIDLLLDVASRRYWVNDTSPRGYMLERILDQGGGGIVYSKQTVSGKAVRYVDWLIPGVLAMNMMFSALFGVGYVIVRYRKNGVLKRLKATPLSAFEFLSAQVISRLWLILGLSAAVYIGTDLFVQFTMFGSYLTLFLVFALGAICVISLGLLISARTASEELAGGLLNLISWPMIFLSGVWFSLEGAHPLVRSLAQLFPLTHVIDGARAVMLDGAGILDVSPQLLVLAAMTALFLVIGSFSFRWE